MRALELDYLKQPSSKARWLLTAAALAFAAHTGVYYHSLQDRVAAMEARLPRMKTIPAPQAVNSDEFAFAREVVGRLATPWDRLFQELEAAQTDRVALLSIEPEADSRTVTITGEAKDYLAALTYVAGLAEQPGLTRVHLVRHESRQRGRLAFTVSAAWKEK